MDSNTPSSATGSPRLIDLTKDTDVNFWCRALNVTPTQLREAVQHAGHQVDAIQRYLRDKGITAA
ncbi:MAG: DUF3606 domain-containing protein [Pseudomonadota bacterium]